MLTLESNLEKDNGCEKREFGWLECEIVLCSMTKRERRNYGQRCRKEKREYRLQSKQLNKEQRMEKYKDIEQRNIEFYIQEIYPCKQECRKIGYRRKRISSWVIMFMSLIGLALSLVAFVMRFLF